MRIPRHHQCYMFRIGDSYKPSFVTVTGKGENPRYCIYLFCILYTVYRARVYFVFCHTYMLYIYMGVSKNRGTPKSSILIGFSLLNRRFWGTTIFGNTHIYIYTYIYICILVILRIYRSFPFPPHFIHLQVWENCPVRKRENILQRHVYDQIPSCQQVWARPLQDGSFAVASLIL